MLTARKQGVGDFNALMRRRDAVRTQAFRHDSARDGGVAGVGH
jgi:hypothetical protein